MKVRVLAVQRMDGDKAFPFATPDNGTISRGVGGLSSESAQSILEGKDSEGLEREFMFSVQYSGPTTDALLTHIQVSGYPRDEECETVEMDDEGGFSQFPLGEGAQIAEPKFLGWAEIV